MPQSNPRSLGVTEARRLLSIDKAAQVDKARKEVGKWPGSFNKNLLAQAVDNRRQFVDFEPDNQRFSIRYDGARKAVFVRPVNGEFIPCGWFSYEDLKHSFAGEENA